MNYFAKFIEVLDAFARLFGPIAWPVAVVVAVLILRNAIQKALEVLASRIKSAEAGGAKFEFEASLASAEKEAGKIETQPLTPPPPDGNQAATQKVFGRKIADSFEHLVKLAEVDPNAAIVSSWVKVEVTLNKILDDSGFNGFMVPRSGPALIKFLANNGKLKRDVAAVLLSLNNTRNLAAHPSPGENPTTSEAKRFVSLVENLLIQTEMK